MKAAPWVLLILASAILWSGCSFPSKTKIIPPKVDIRDHRQTTIDVPGLPDGPPTKVTTDGTTVEIPGVKDAKIVIDRNITGQASGAGIETTSDESLNKFKSDPPVVNLPDDVSAGGGSFSLTSKLRSLNGKESYFFYGIGALLFVGGVAYFIWGKSKPKGVILMIAGTAWAGVGLTFIQYPWIIALGVILSFLSGILFLIWDRVSARKEQVLQKVVTGIENAPPEAAEVVKKAIEDEDENGDIKLIITSIKRSNK